MRLLQLPPLLLTLAALGVACRSTPAPSVAAGCATRASFQPSGNAAPEAVENFGIVLHDFGATLRAVDRSLCCGGGPEEHRACSEALSLVGSSTGPVRWRIERTAARGPVGEVIYEGPEDPTELRREVLDCTDDSPGHWTSYRFFADDLYLGEFVLRCAGCPASGGGES